MTCIASTAHHVLTGSEDSTVNVWSLPSLLELDSSAAADGAGEHEPTLSLSHHRAAVVALSIGPGTNRDTRVAVSASRDKTCVVWNYQTGDTLRTLLFPTPPLCICLDACLRALFVSCEEGSDEAGGSGAMYAVELFSSARPPLLGPRAAEDPGTVVQIPRASAFAVPPPDAGPASCLALTADGLSLVSGHTRGQMFLWSAVDGDEPPVLLADLNASVANVVFCSPPARARGTKVSAMVRPSRGDGANYNFTARLEGNLGPETRFTRMLGCTGIPAEELEKASVAFQEPATAESEGEAALRAQLEELWALYNEQRALQQTTQQLYLNAKKGR